MALHGCGDSVIGLLIQIHHMNTSFCHIVDIQKLPTGSAGAQDRHFWCIIYFSFMDTAYQGWNNVAVLRMVVVADAVEVA